jgi:hypothetical protein
MFKHGRNNQSLSTKLGHSIRLAILETEKENVSLPWNYQQKKKSKLLWHVIEISNN